MIAAYLASSGALASLPGWAVVGVALLACVCLAVAGRVVTNTVLNGSAPPVFEGLPYIGGILKFARVRGRPGARIPPTRAGL